MFPPVTVVTGAAAPLLLPNVDTDVIIRIERLTTVDPAALGPFAFEPLRYRPDGGENPEFVLNRERFRGAPILLAGPNFGCGSSREPAVWALAGCGIRCVVAPSFGDIFEANCAQNGLLAVTLPEPDVEQLAVVAAHGTEVTVDLRAQQIAAGDTSWPFAIAAPCKAALLEGVDDLGLALRHLDDIRTWELRDRARRPWAWTVNEGATP